MGVQRQWGAGQEDCPSPPPIKTLNQHLERSGQGGARTSAAGGESFAEQHVYQLCALQDGLYQVHQLRKSQAHPLFNSNLCFLLSPGLEGGVAAAGC